MQRTDMDTYTALHMACEKGLKEIANTLIKKSDELKIDLNSKARYGYTLFHYGMQEWP